MLNLLHNIFSPPLQTVAADIDIAAEEISAAKAAVEEQKLRVLLSQGTATVPLYPSTAEDPRIICP